MGYRKDDSLDLLKCLGVKTKPKTPQKYNMTRICFWGFEVNRQKSAIMYLGQEYKEDNMRVKDVSRPVCITKLFSVTLNKLK